MGWEKLSMWKRSRCDDDDGGPSKKFMLHKRVCEHEGCCGARYIVQTFTLDINGIVPRSLNFFVVFVYFCEYP